MYLPLEEMQQDIKEIKELLSKSSGPAQPIEIIDRVELMKRLKCTEPTIIRYVRRKKIPEIKIGSNCRYNWPEVVASLQKG